MLTELKPWGKDRGEQQDCTQANSIICSSPGQTRVTILYLLTPQQTPKTAQTSWNHFKSNKSKRQNLEELAFLLQFLLF